MWVSALLLSCVWQLLCNAQAVIALPFVSLNSLACVWFSSDKIHVLCKMFSSRHGLSLDSYVWSAFQIPEDLLPFSSGLGFTLTFTQEKKGSSVWPVSQLGCMFGSSAHGRRCAQISRREQSVNMSKSEGRVGMGQWAFQTSVCSSGCGTP